MNNQTVVGDHSPLRAGVARNTILIVGLAVLFVPLLLVVSCSNADEATATPESRIDTTMKSYLQELAILRDALTEFGNPDGSGGSLQDIRDATNLLVGYDPFFASLTQDRRTYINETYGAELASLLRQITNRVIGAVEISGEAEIAQLVQQIPGLGATSSETSR